MASGISAAELVLDFLLVELDGLDVVADEAVEVVAPEDDQLGIEGQQAVGGFALDRQGRTVHHLDPVQVVQAQDG